MAQWTQDDAIAFESARECITHLMAIWTALMDADELAADELSLLRAKRSALASERRRLRVEDRDEVARIRRVYGEACRLNNPIEAVRVLAMRASTAARP